MLTREPVADATTPRRSRLVLAARVALALAWLAWAVLAWWTTPREANVSRLVADMQAGRVASFTTSPWRPPFQWVSLANGPRRADMLVWKTSDHRAFYTHADRHLLDREDLADQLARQGVAYGEMVWLQRAAMLALVLGLTGLLIVISGPAPARGTRPFWFWVGQLPFGLGFVAWLALERPWAEVADAPRKRNGFVGFAYLILGGLATGAIVELIS